MKPPTSEEARKEHNISKPMWKALASISEVPLDIQGDVSAAIQRLEIEVRHEGFLKHLSKLQQLKDKYEKGCLDYYTHYCGCQKKCNGIQKKHSVTFEGSMCEDGLNDLAYCPSCKSKISAIDEAMK